MVTVPSVAKQSARPLSQARQTARDPGTDPAAQSLSGLGQSVANAGQELAAGVKIMNDRNDTINRARATDEFNTKARDLALQEQDQGTNFEDPEAIKRYQQQLQQEHSRLLASHNGSADSQGRLDLMLGDVSSRHSAQALQIGRVSQKAAIEKQVAQVSVGLTEKVVNDPTKLPEAILEFEQSLSNYADATTPQELDAMHEAGISSMVGGIVQENINLGNTAEARAVFDQTKEIISPSARRKLRQGISALEGQEAKKNAEIAARRTRLKEAGVNISDPRIALAIEGINLPASSKTLTASERLVEFEAVKSARLGRPYKATKREVDIIFDLAKKTPDTGSGSGGLDSIFGKGATGRANAFIAQNAPDFASGNLTPEMERFFIAATSIVSAPNPITGQPGGLSPFAVEALARRGIDPRQVTNAPGLFVNPNVGADFLGAGDTPAAQAAGAAQVAPTDPASLEQPIPQISPPPAVGEQQEGFVEPGSAEDQPFLEPEAAIEQSRQFEAQGGLLAPQATLPQKTLFGLADLLTGPVSTVQAGVARVPGVGGALSNAAVVQARAFMPVLVKDLVRVLQNNPKFAEGERQAIQKDIELESRFFDNATRFRNNLIGLDDALAVRQQNAIEKLQVGQISRAETEHTLNVLAALVKFRKAMGVPPIVSEEEARQLEPGEMFRLDTNPTEVLRVKQQ